MKAHLRPRPSLLALLALLAWPLLPAATRAQTLLPLSQKVIKSLPYTISSPGNYVLGADLTYDEPGGGSTLTAAILINVDNVTIDFAGHAISGLGAGKGTEAYGLYAKDRANVTVQNGAIGGFLYGIILDGSDLGDRAANNKGNVIQNMRLPSNTHLGIYLINPVTCRVEGCQINATGDTTALPNTDGYGILVYGGSATIKNNQVSVIGGAGNGSGYGIFCNGSASHFVIGNQVDNCTRGVRLDAGAKRQDNLTAACSTAFEGGVDAGGNF